MTDHRHLFVSIHLCTRLQELGLTPDTWAKYRQYPSGELSIVAPGFDYEGLYEEIELPAGLKMGYLDTPAYTLMDMLQCIPQYFVSIDNGEYEIACFKAYNLPMTSDRRLPDAAALMVERIIRDRVIPIDTLNQNLSSPKINN